VARFPLRILNNVFGDVKKMKIIIFSFVSVLISIVFSATAATAQPATKNTKPTATFQRVWVDYDITEAGKRGMRIHTAFKVSVYLQIKFQKRDGTALMDKNGAFDHEDGSVAAFRSFKPGYDPAVYEDYEVFMPYDELDLPAGKYELRMDIDIIYEAGELIEHLTFHNFDFTQPAKTPVKTSTGGSATFQRIWVDYDVTEGGKRGMRIHTAFKVFGMKGVDSYLQIKFQRSDGTALMDKNGEFVHEDGSVAAFVKLRPGYDPAVFEDEAIFMPYSELDLTSGKHNLKMDVDVIYEDGGLIGHLTFYEFEYTKP
jgi:hypothetical protein